MNTLWHWMGCMALPALVAAQHPGVSLVTDGVFDCFPDGAKEGEKLCYCETSAVVLLGDRLYLASDKNTPEGTAVFWKVLKPATEQLSGWELQAGIEYVRSSPLRDAKKYEDFARSPDSDWVFATTGFDRVIEGQHQEDGYNDLLAWKKGADDRAQIVSPTTADGTTSSVSLRNAIEGALSAHHGGKAFPYFKIEGLAALPKQKLLFGVRERGNKYDDFDYAIDLIQVSYRIENDQIVLKNDWKVVYSISNTPTGYGDLVTPLGLSSIEYDPFGKRFYLLTSFELEEKGVGAYLWILTPKQLKKRQQPTLVQQDGKPFRFVHKAEDLTPIAANQIFVIHDDDRQLDFPQNSRKPHQAAYSILKLQ